ncbi:MAG: amino acid adenylation domain-containing protein [Burkholderia sp.]|uniref:amino acid adenylation domain-containing protein n=1 Tax=Burkholderia sp. TaxID=36773 RepID=UPI00258BC10C|nr:amino acid adenylation domain-containing protein [Burkholderia sp.]MCA3867616.1 amino acid adenylation domain-containing protein [Burkholderia sp.]
MTESLYSPHIPHRVFEQCAAARPERIAAISDRESVTYGELNARANRLARFLRDEVGIRAGEAVGVCTDHDPVRLVALLAIVKCGAVYVPVDAACPEDRMRHMVQRARIAFVLTALEGRAMTQLGGVPQSDVYVALKRASELSSDNLGLDAELHDPLYVIFTSGSTGLPKGVAVSHAAAWNHFSWIIGYLGFREDDRWLQSINPCFDPSMHELLAPLTIGATVCFLGGTHRIDSVEIVAAIRRHAATHITTVPTMFNLITQTPDFDQCTSLKAICVGGEVFRPSLAERARRLLPDTVVHNVYGPTEATIMASAWPYDDAPRDSLPIGAPVSHTRFDLRRTAADGVTDAVVPPAPGEEGELCISGAALANGYVNDAAETALRFIANPLFEAGDLAVYSRIYLTGDICRVDADGWVHCVGRVDDQVKINGQRVELAEIESAVLRAPMVRDATALVVGDRLTAIVVLADGHDTAWMRTLSETAALTLPAAWLPKDWVAVAEIPRQAMSGKADRRALVDLCRQATERARADDAPATDVESEIGRVLAELIGLGSDALIDRDEPFADIGLDSLGVQALSLRLSSTFGVSLRAEDMFEYYTIDLLSREIHSRLATA